MVLSCCYIVTVKGGLASACSGAEQCAVFMVPVALTSHQTPNKPYISENLLVSCVRWCESWDDCGKIESHLSKIVGGPKAL